MSSMFEFKQQLKWPFNQFQFEVSGNQQPQLTYSISNETSIFSSQDYKISPSTYSTALNDQTQQKKKEKLKKIEERCKQIELYAKFIDEEEPCDEEQVKKQSKPNSKLQIQKYFTCQNININQQFRDHIQIYYGNILIDDQNMKNKLISEIVGDSNQQEEHKNILGEYIQNEQYNIIMNNHFSTRKYFTIQRLYYRKDDTCSVSVKTCISQDAKRFEVQKIFEKTSRQTIKQFENQVQYEIDILKLINQSNTHITLPFIKEEISQESNQSKKYILNIDSGIKNLLQVKHFYQTNKKYVEYNVILEYAFCQLLLKLNQMHRVCKIAHSDIKPANIVIGYDLQFYYIDFGASIYLNDLNSCNSYLGFCTTHYNLNLFLEKKQNEWKYEEIIDCDTSQLILSFMNMIDVEDSYYKHFKNVNLDNFEQYRKNIKPEFKRLGKYLLRSLMYIIQKQEDPSAIPPKQKIFLFSDFAEQLTKKFNSLYDIKKQKNSYGRVLK